MHESFELYRQYLEEKRSRFPPAIFEFAASVERHNLDSPHSLHDAWLSSMLVKENRRTHRPFEPRPSIELAMLGPRHDRDIILTYEGVSSYRVEGNRNPYNLADTFHGDVSCHEVRITEEGLIVHEIAFVSQSSIVVTCESFTCTEREHT
jgi:hypothetical protein